MAEPRPHERTQLPFLDGIRGVAALYVTFHHAAIMVPPAELGRVARSIAPYFYMGHAAVSVFIVLSGYCLMLPVVRSSDGWLRGGYFGYLARRARRILPAYYAALGLSLLAAALPPMARWARTPWDLAQPALRLDVVLSHVFLVHNLRMKWFYRVDPPMWSVATEWQIYFLFPVLVLIWRRAGIAAAVVAAIGASACLAFIPRMLGLGAGPWAVQQMCPWYLGLFALGMAAAVVGFSRGRCAGWSRSRLPWGLLTLGLGLLSAARQTRYGDSVILNDAIMGLATASLLIFCDVHHRTKDANGRPPIVAILSARSAVVLGSFSYSLYLLNFPLLALANLLLRRWAAADWRLAILMAAAVPMVVAVSYGFSSVFERKAAPALPPMPLRGPIGRVRAHAAGMDAPAELR